MRQHTNLMVRLVRMKAVLTGTCEQHTCIATGLSCAIYTRNGAWNLNSVIDDSSNLRPSTTAPETEDASFYFCVGFRTWICVDAQWHQRAGTGDRLTVCDRMTPSVMDTTSKCVLKRHAVVCITNGKKQKARSKGVNLMVR